MAIVNSLGGALGLQGKPDSFVDEALNNARSNRAEEARKRAEQAKKDNENADRYDNIIGKLKVEGYDPIYNDEIKRKAADVIGTLQEIYKQNKSADPYNNSNFTKKLQDFQIFSDEAKQATKALAEDYTLTTGGKKTLKPELAAALQENNYEAYQKALGGQKHYRRGMGINDVEESFDYIKLKSAVNTAYKPFDKVVEFQDPKTGNFITTENQFYENPLAATQEVLSTQPKAAEFFTAQFQALPIAKQKEYSLKAQQPGASGVAYLEYASDRLFPDQGFKSITTLQQATGTGGSGPVTKKTINVTENISDNGTKVVAFQRPDPTENKDLQFVMKKGALINGQALEEDMVISGVPAFFTQKGEVTPTLTITTKDGESIELPYTPEVANNINNEYGFNYYDIKEGNIPKNVNFKKYGDKPKKSQYEGKKEAYLKKFGILENELTKDDLKYLEQFK